MKYAKFIPNIVRIIAVVVIIAFFVPYCCVSCSDEDVFQMSLSNLATGFDAFGYEDYHVDAHPIVAILLASPIVILAASFLVRKEVPKACINAFCAVLILYFNSSIANEIKKQCAEAGCMVEMKIANTIYIVSGIALIIISLYSIYSETIGKKTVTTRTSDPERTTSNPPEWGRNPETYGTKEYANPPTPPTAPDSSFTRAGDL